MTPEEAKKAQGYEIPPMYRTCNRCHHCVSTGSGFEIASGTFTYKCGVGNFEVDELGGCNQFILKATNKKPSDN